MSYFPNFEFFKTVSVLTNNCYRSRYQPRHIPKMQTETQELFPNITTYKSTSSGYLPLEKPIKLKDREVTTKMISNFTSRREKSFINLKTHRDAVLRNATRNAIEELAEKFPNYSCFILLGECELPFGSASDEYAIFDSFRLHANRNDSTKKIFVTLSLQRRTSPATHKQMLREMIPLKSGVAVTIPDEDIDEDDEEPIEEDNHLRALRDYIAEDTTRKLRA